MTVSITRLLFELERYEQTLDWVRAYRNSGNHTSDHEIDFIEGLSLLHTGRRDEATRLLQGLASKTEQGPWVLKSRRTLSELQRSVTPIAP
jgi:hypothetical protein